jgi:hypothetical protein
MCCGALHKKKLSTLSTKMLLDGDGGDAADDVHIIIIILTTRAATTLESSRKISDTRIQVSLLI